MPRLPRVSWSLAFTAFASAAAAGLATCGILAALKLALLVADPLRPTGIEPAEPTSTTRREDRRDLQHAVASTRPLEAQGATPEQARAPASQAIPSSAMLEAPRCAPGLRLRGTILVSGQPERSMAALSNGRGTVVLHVGDVFEGARLAALRSDRAYLIRGHSACQLPLYLPAAERARFKEATAQRRKRTATRPDAFSPEELTRAIRRTAADRYSISRAFLLRALSKLAGMQGLGRFVPAVEGGKQVGMRVHGVKRGSLLARLGIRNGDVLQTLNGVPLTSTDGVLEAYEQLRDKRALSLAVLRSGQPRTLAYTVD